MMDELEENKGLIVSVSIVVILLVCIAFLVYFMNYKNMVIGIDNNTDSVRMEMLSETEYTYGEEGQIIVSLLNKSFVPITADCKVDIIYPNKSMFVDNGVMVR